MAGEARQTDMALIESYVSGADLEKPVALTTDEIDRDEALAIAESTPATTASEEEHTDEQHLTEERLKEAKRQAGEEKETAQGMSALQKEEARQAEKARKTAAAAASRPSGFMGLQTDVAKAPYEFVQNVASDTAATLERASTPGSILLPVLILIVLFLAVMPVNGYPRLAWLWFVVTGNASLTGGTPAASMAPAPPPPVNTQAATGAREDQNTIAHRQLVQYHAYTGIEDVE
jgi:hypothetical protein